MRKVSPTHIYSGECRATALRICAQSLKKNGFRERIFGNHLVFNTRFIYKTPVSNDFLYTRTQASRLCDFSKQRTSRRPAGPGGVGSWRIRSVSPAPPRAEAERVPPASPRRDRSPCAPGRPRSSGEPPASLPANPVPATRETCLHELLKS